MGILREGSQYPEKEISEVSVSAPSRYKPIVLEVLSVSAAYATGFLYSRFLAGDINVWWLAAIVCVFAVLVSLSVLMISGWKRRVLVTVLEAVALSVSFLSSTPMFLVAGALFFLVFSLWGEWESKKRIQDSLQIRFFRSVRPKLEKSFTGLAIFSVLLFLPSWTVEDAFVSDEAFSGLYDSALGVVGNIFPGFRFDSSIEDFAESIIKPRLFESGPLVNLPPDLQDVALRTAVSQAVTSAGEGLGIKLSSGDSLEATFYRYLSGKLADLYDRFGTFFIMIWAVAVFFIVRGLGAILIWIVAGAGFLIYEMLLTFGICSVRGETCIRETVGLF